MGDLVSKRPKIRTSEIYVVSLDIMFRSRLEGAAVALAWPSTSSSRK